MRNKIQKKPSSPNINNSHLIKSEWWIYIETILERRIFDIVVWGFFKKYFLFI